MNCKKCDQTAIDLSIRSLKDIPNGPKCDQKESPMITGSGIYEQMDDNQRDFLDTITNYNIEARYPEDKNALTHTLTPQVCRQIIVETKQLQQWIKDRL